MAGWGRCSRTSRAIGCGSPRWPASTPSASLDKVDAWIGEGVLGGEALNAADFMIAPSVALIMYRRDLGPEIEARPAGRLAERVLPEPEALAAA